MNFIFLTEESRKGRVAVNAKRITNMLGYKGPTYAYTQIHFSGDDYIKVVETIDEILKKIGFDA